MKKLGLMSLVAALVMSLAFVLTACGGGSSNNDPKFELPASDGIYTYRSATNSLPTSWNSHTYQSNDATTVTGYTTDSLYTFDYNENKDGYKIVPSMATDFPVDATADFVGQYGIEEGDANRVYKITLRQDLKFDNGDPIDANTFVTSMQYLLAPEAANYRADSYFSGNLIIYGARDYAYAGTTVVASARDRYESWEEAKTDSALYIDFLSNNTGFNAYCASRYPDYFEQGGEGTGWAWMIVGFGGATTAEDVMKLQGKTWAEIEASEELKAIWDIVIGIWQTEPNEELDFFGYDDKMPEYSWDNVGFFADPEDQYTLYVVNVNELEGFYLLYSLSTDFFLIHPETYENCISTEAGVYTNSYGTSVDTYVGFGPYKLVEYTADNSCKFAKNEYWYGYADPANEGLYQTTNITVLQVSDAQTRLNMFLAGDLDAYGLDAADMEDYQSSPHTYYTDGDSTWFVALNPDMAGLKAAQEAATPINTGVTEVNKTIITIKEFRQALSFSIDRAAYALALDPVGGTAKAIYGNMIISDPENGVAYRTTEEAKDVILAFWGLTDLVGSVYSSKDEAIASITGYDLAGAKRLFDVAYDKAVEQGLITDTANFEIQIMIGQPGTGSSAYYNNGYELLKQVWTDAVVGTKLEGRLTFQQSEPLGSSKFSEFLKNNQVDVLFGVGWTGSALDPYGLMEAYVAPSYQYDPGWDTSATTLDVTLTLPVYDDEGNATEETETLTLRSSVYAWGAEALGGKDIEAFVVVDGEVTEDSRIINAGASADPAMRLTILAAVEGAVLQQYDMIPILLDSSAALKGMKITYGTEEYVFGVGRGGVKYMTYNYSDNQWEAFVDFYAKDGQLNYKA